MINFDPVTRTFIYGPRDCHACSHGLAHGGQRKGRRVAWHGKTHDACKGTGRRGSGRCRGCNRDDYMAREYGAGNVRDYESPYDAGPCNACDGTGEEQETRYGRLTTEVAALVMDTIGNDDIRIIAGDEQTASERLFGVVTMRPESMGMTNFWGTTDYGRAWDALRKAAQTDSTARALSQDDPHALRAAIDDFKATIRSKIISSPGQGVSWALPDETIIDMIIVRITRGGYTIMGGVRSILATQAVGITSPTQPLTVTSQPDNVA